MGMHVTKEARLLCKQTVVSSILTVSTILRKLKRNGR